MTEPAADLNYTSDHEWIAIDGDIATVGITDYAQAQLGDVVFVELPATGASVEKGAQAAVVESVKAASEVYAPVSGEIVEVNQAVVDQPDLVNADPFGDAWMIKVRFTQLPAFLTAAEYEALTA